MQRSDRDAEDDKRKKRERELAVLLLLLSSSLNRQSRLLVAGSITQQGFLVYATTVIRQSHFQAAALGVAQAGGYAYNAYTVATRAADAQASFIDSFARDLANGRYDAKSDGGEGAAARKRRFDLYGLRLTGTANDAMLAVAKAQGLRVLWELGGNEDHCYRCPQLAALGWQDARKVHQVPGDGRTPCLVRCKCRQRYSTGVVSFSNSV